MCVCGESLFKISTQSINHIHWVFTFSINHRNPRHARDQPTTRNGEWPITRADCAFACTKITLKLLSKLFLIVVLCLPTPFDSKHFYDIQCGDSSKRPLIALKSLGFCVICIYTMFALKAVVCCVNLSFSTLYTQFTQQIVYRFSTHTHTHNRRDFGGKTLSLLADGGTHWYAWGFGFVEGKVVGLARMQSGRVCVCCTRKDMKK